MSSKEKGKENDEAKNNFHGIQDSITATDDMQRSDTYIPS
uniref:Uncharacterized protein n=1 Tax=Arundo donax TaxID=35708 RepID=A0A0A9FN36_ARUDO